MNPIKIPFFIWAIIYVVVRVGYYVTLALAAVMGFLYGLIDIAYMVITRQKKKFSRGVKEKWK